MEDHLNKNQENQEIKWGGKRVGAGRPEGTGHKPKLVDDLSDEQKEKIVNKTFQQAVSGDARLLQFLMEQLYGKASQAVDLGGRATLILEIAKQVADKHDTPSDTGEGSGRSTSV